MLLNYYTSQYFCVNSNTIIKAKCVLNLLKLVICEKDVLFEP